MKTLNVLTLAMLMGVCSSAVANYNDKNKGMHPHHSSRHMRHHSNDAKGGEMKKTKKMKKEKKSSKTMKEEGKNTRRRYSKN
jgi:hypothetical protein